MTKIKLEGNCEQYYRKNNSIVIRVIGGIEFIGTLIKEHPNFDKSLVRNDHYYGKIDYYLDVFGIVKNYKGGKNI